MDITVNNNIILKPIDKENATLLFPLFRADLKEISQWFPFDEGYQLAYDLSYVEEKQLPYDETFVIYYQGESCGRIGLYDYTGDKKEIYLYYWVASPYRRKHIALDSVSAVIEYLKTIGIESVLFDVKRENTSSISLISHLPNAGIINDDPDMLLYRCSIQ